MPLFSKSTSNQTVANLLGNTHSHLKQCAKKITPAINTYLKDELKLAPEILTHMGLEIELEHVYLTSLAQGSLGAGDPGEFLSAYPESGYAGLVFVYKEDGSLRNNGLEFVSRYGATGQQICAALPHLFSPKVFTKSPTCGPRTSIHVHVNCLEYRIEDLKKLLFWYIYLEPVFFGLSGMRDRNIFCVPVTKSACAPYVSAFLNATTWNEILQYTNTIWRKYSAFNLSTLQNFGTIEFRHHRGSNSVNEIQQWLMFIDQFVHVAVSSKKSLEEEATYFFAKHEKNQGASYLEQLFGFFGMVDEEKFNQHLDAVTYLFQNPNQFLSADLKSAEGSFSPKKKFIPDMSVDDAWEPPSTMEEFDPIDEEDGEEENI